MKKWWAFAVAFALVLGMAPVTMADDGDYEWDWFGTLRIRPEWNDNLSGNTFNVAGREFRLAYAAYRANMGFQVDVGNDVSVLVDTQFVGTFGDNRTPFFGGPSGTVADPYNIDPSVLQARAFARGYGFDTNDFQLFRAYIDAKNINGTGFSARLGRQPLVFGDEWVLGDLDFYGGTSWDGLRGDFEVRWGSVTAFWGKASERDAPELAAILQDDFNDDADLYGLWSDIAISDDSGADVGILYWVDHTETRGPVFGDFAWQDKRVTVTGRYHYGGETGFQFNGNIAFQDGSTIAWDRSESQGIDAEAVELTAGWRWDRSGNPTEISLRASHYSGDDPNTDANESYFNPFQDFHNRYGILDFWHGFWGRSAYVNGEGGFRSLAFHWDSQIKPGLSIFGTMLTAERAEQVSESDKIKNLGDEFGIGVRYDYGEAVQFELGLAQLFTGIALESELGGGETASNVRRVYVNTTVHF